MVYAVLICNYYNMYTSHFTNIYHRHRHCVLHAAFAMTSEFLSSITLGWVVMFLDSYRTVFIFLSWLDLLGVALAFLISILKIFKLLPIYRHRITEMTSFEKHFESSSGHTPRFRFKNMFLKESLTRSSSVILSTNSGGSNAKRISSRRARKLSNAYDV